MPFDLVVGDSGGRVAISARRLGCRDRKRSGLRWLGLVTVKENQMPQKLSERQEKILSFIDEYLRDYGYPPTIREIGKAAAI